MGIELLVNAELAVMELVWETDRLTGAASALRADKTKAPSLREPALQADETQTPALEIATEDLTAAIKNHCTMMTRTSASNS